MVGPTAPAWPRRALALTLLSVAVLAVLPFLRGLLAGNVLYFRDLAILFHPFREFVVDGLRRGEVRYWDPYVHEGIPLPYLPVAYPLDLLQALWPGPHAVTWILALHLPLAAAAFVLLARGLGASPLAAGLGGLVYALNGFALSMVNLYVYVEALAWAPLVVLGILRAARADGRTVVLAALAVALCFSTTGIEVALQAALLGLLLALSPSERAATARAAGAVALGGLLAAPLLLVMRGTMAGTERASGFSVDVVLNQSVHPFTLVQVVVANLYGDLSALPDRWWGSNFFDRGFPYVLSVYLGAPVLALAAIGLLFRFRDARRLAALALVALVVSLGRWAGLEPLLEVVPPPLRVFRYPTKAWFTVALAVSLLASMGVDALRAGPRPWKAAAAGLAALGLPLALLPVWPRLSPGSADWFVRHFFPPAVPLPVRAGFFVEILADAARGGALALAGAALAVLVLRRRLPPATGAAALAALAVADLVRAGAGLNPMVEPSFLRTSPEVAAAVESLPGRQRLFTCDPQASRAYWRARAASPARHERLTFAVWMDTLTPNFNRPLRVPTALGVDLTSLAPLSRLLPDGLGCHEPAGLVDALRRAGVSHLVSLDPVHHPALPKVAEVGPPRIAPLRVHVHAVPDPLPLRHVARTVRRGEPPADGPAADVAWIAAAPQEVDGAEGRVEVVAEHADELVLEVAADRATALVLREGWARGWSASVDGVDASVLRAGHHRAVWVPAGRSRVRLTYAPPGLGPGLALGALGAALSAALVWPPRSARARS